MKLQQIRIAGFKSFVDPTEVRIEEGLTGVVGPNGCGKSNILESIRWGMGASSARALRGGDMDDVIFAGTDARPARDLCEVTLVLDNAAKRAPAQWNDAEVIEVQRRIRRGAGSSFRINGREARGRDVQLLFADASTGANSPALVRQGQVSELINAKPENRRRILEEAAGVAGLHARRHEAEGKLRAADVNLGRLDEMIRALDDQMKVLQRQTVQAQRYRALAEQIRGLEAFLLAGRLAEARRVGADASAELLRVEAAIADQTRAVSAAQRALLEVEETLPAAQEEKAIAEALARRLEAQRYDLDRALGAAREALERADADAQRIRADRARETALLEDADAALARLAADAGEGEDREALAEAAEAAKAAADRADAARQTAEAAFAAAQTQASEAAGRRAALSQAFRDASARRDRARAAAAEAARALQELPLGPPIGEIARAESAVAAASAAIEDARLAAEIAERAADEATQAEQAARDAERAANAAFDTIEAEIRGLEAVARRAPAGGKAYPAVLEQCRAARGYERALAAALGDDLNAALTAEAAAYWAGATAEAFPWPEGVEPLAAKVSAPPALAATLALIGVTQDGGGQINALKPGQRLVSQAGDLWRWDGFVRRAEAPSPAAVLLEQRNRLEDLKLQRVAAEEARVAGSAAVQTARLALEEARDAARQARARGPAALSALSDARAALARITAERDRAEASRAAKEEAASRLAAEALEMDAAATAAEAALADAPPPPAETALSALRVQADEARAAAAMARAAAAEATGALTGAERRAAERARDHAEWNRRKAQAESRLAALEAAAAAAEEIRTRAQQAPGEVEDRRRKLLGEAPAIEARTAAAADALAALETRARAAREAERAAEHALAAARETRGALTSRMEAAAQRVSDLEDQTRQTLRCEPDELERRATAALGDDVTARLGLDEAERKLDRLMRERDGLGAVNLAAEDQVAEQSARLEALAAERADLTAAIAKLRTGIIEINEEGRERLLKAFDVVHGHFRALFTTLFEGGEAELKLALGDDPLSGGLEILACPPGKKLQTMSLLSGGEQALTASALIFAVFLSNPAPLCVLDEVDAPLDDANVDRYCRLLDEMRRRTDTRFIVITHHPLTMARMDRLYGVTMVERGVSQLVSVDLRRAEELVAG